ncbi:LuxR C-terminal-related transcriptional regulator [Kitasatospora aureofaciens]|uniref:helix-turn-helix domain-containing protein n=1 Tax=Kitasatospora aureofaciens TaxID=1894 RepID=UPI001C48E77C|nr:LuxR C-terminal-related transcriptional regulator [Kitasatospora aureofaciens]MBV6695672.1 LuxR C-terminal-related transcriptional regulator [Kitasatospora aureofaciens]
MAKPALSPHERRIAQHLVQGSTPKQIRDDLGVSQASINSSVSRLFRRLGLANRTHLVAYCTTYRWVDTAKVWDGLAVAPPELDSFELELLRLVAEGQTIERAARTLQVAPDTAAHRLKGVREKIGARNLRHAVAAALLLDLIRPRLSARAAA